MTGYRLSPRAQADVEDIWDYTVDRWGDGQAEAYIRDIYLAVEGLVATPVLPVRAMTFGGDIGNIRLGRT